MRIEDLHVAAHDAMNNVLIQLDKLDFDPDGLRVNVVTHVGDKGIICEANATVRLQFHATSEDHNKR